MKTRKLLERVKRLFNEDLRNSEKKRRALREILEKLKEKETNLKLQLEATQNPQERLALEQKIQLVHSQRKKGLMLLKDHDL